MEVSQSVRPEVSPASVMSHVVVPSSTTWGAYSTRPCTLRKRASVLRLGSREVSTWEESVVSQLSRSGPLTVTTPRWDWSTTARPRARARCSGTGSP